MPPKVTLNPTPTQELIAKAQAEVVVKDSAGRAITLKKPGVLAQYRLVEVLGDSAANRTYVNMVMPVIYVAAIDGEAVYVPSKKSEVEALIQQLDEHGLDAVMQGIAQHFGASDADKDKAALKN